MKLTLIKGARMSGKSRYVLDNLTQHNTVITPNIGMAKQLLNRYAELVKQDCPRILNHGSFFQVRTQICTVTFATIYVAYPAIRRFDACIYDTKTLWLEELTMWPYTELERTIKFASQCSLDIVATFTPTPITPNTAHRQGWLQVGNWYEGDIEWMNLYSYRSDEELQAFKAIIPPEHFQTEFLGEWVIEDNTPKGVDFA